jgi:hypothetical protein
LAMFLMGGIRRTSGTECYAIQAINATKVQKCDGRPVCLDAAAPPNVQY